MEQENQQEVQPKLVHPLTSVKSFGPPKALPLTAAILVILAGIGSGFILSQNQINLPSVGGKPKVIKTEKMVGSTDVKTFKDTAEGTLEKGGIDGEGTHKLLRPGGESQTVFLTSSIINLDDYIGKRVRVWGETFAAQKAGWLMDVGRVEVLK